MGELDAASLRTLREQFPITRSGKAFFGHCTASPLPAAAVAAVRRVLEHTAEHGGMDSSERIALRTHWRSVTAALIGAEPDEIAFANNTVDGLHVVANGLAWRAGDVIVSADCEFPANVYPWLNLQSRGVEVRFVHSRDGRIEAEDVIAALDERTRLVALSLVQFATGQRIDAERIGAECRARGIYFLLDAIQAIGALEVDMRRYCADFACAGGHKWLLGPIGSGLLYCRREVLDQLHVATMGHGSMLPQDDPLAYRIQLRPDASRFEGGAPNVLAQYGLAASTDLLAGIGIAKIEARIRALGSRLADGLVERGYCVRSPSLPRERSGIVAFASERHDAQELTARLASRGVIVSPTSGLVRAAPHVYTSEEDVDRLLAALP